MSEPTREQLIETGIMLLKRAGVDPAAMAAMMGGMPPAAGPIPGPMPAPGGPMPGDPAMMAQGMPPDAMAAMLGQAPGAASAAPQAPAPGTIPAEAVAAQAIEQAQTSDQIAQQALAVSQLLADVAKNVIDVNVVQNVPPDQMGDNVASAAVASGALDGISPEEIAELALEEEASTTAPQDAATV